MLSTLKLFPLWPAILNIQLLSQFLEELSTLGVQERVAGYRHKMVLGSHLKYLICNRVQLLHFTLSDAILKHILVASTK